MSKDSYSYIYDCFGIDTADHFIRKGDKVIGKFCTSTIHPLTSTWPHLRCDVGLEEGEYRENCLCLAVLCTIVMVHKDTSSSYR